MDLIFNIPAEVELKVRPPHPDKLYDVLVIGAGPAGMTATVYCSRKKLDTLLITKDIGGQVIVTSGIENYMGYHYITGKELADKFYHQISQFPVSLLTGVEVCGLKIESPRFILTCSGNNYQSKSVIIATGRKARELNVPGEREFIGRGVSYCSICDAPLFSNRYVAVIGGGNSALTTVLDLIPYAERIFLLNIMDTLQGDDVLIEKIRNSGKVEIILTHKVQEIKGDKQVTGLVINSVVTQTVRELPVSGVFIEIGLIPNTVFLPPEIKLTDTGEIIIDKECRTSVHGIFAAGDVTNIRDKQIIVACGEGAKSALSSYNYLAGLE